MEGSCHEGRLHGQDSDGHREPDGAGQTNKKGPHDTYFLCITSISLTLCCSDAPALQKVPHSRSREQSVSLAFPFRFSYLRASLFLPELQKDDHVVIRQCAPVSKRKAHTLDRILRSPETEAAAVRATLLAATAADRVAKEAAQVKAEEVMLKETGASREVLDEALKTRMARELFDIESKKEQDRKLAFDEAKKDAMLRD